MDSVCPPDILNLLDASGLSNRKAAFQKNVPTAFASGVVTAEIIHAAYPKLIQLHSFADASNAQGRISNWELLNKKLKLFNCNLGEKDLTAIANRSYGTDDVCNFLRKLQIRMPSYEPVYLTQQMERNTTQKHQTSMQTTGARENTEGNKSPSKATMSKGTAQAVKKRFGTSTAGTSTSGLNINKSAGPAQNLSKAKTNKIMDSIWERQERVKKVAELTDDDIDRMYHEFAVMYKEETDNNNARAEKMNVRSRQIDAHFAALREANLADMDRTARRLTMLQTKPQMMDSMLGFEMDPLDFGEGEREAADIEHASSGYSEDGSSQAPFESVKNAGDNSNKIKKLYSSQRASTIENKLMAFIPDSPAAVVDGKPPIAVGDLDSDLSDDNDSDDDEAPPPPPPKKTQAVSNSAPTIPSTVLSFAATEQVHEVPSVSRAVDYKRVYDAQYKRHYYVSIVSGESQWEAPKEGVVECEDSKKKKFYTDCKTGNSGWSLDALSV